MKKTTNKKKSSKPANKERRGKKKEIKIISQIESEIVENNPLIKTEEEMTDIHKEATEYVDAGKEHLLKQAQEFESGFDDMSEEEIEEEEQEQEEEEEEEQEEELEEHKPPLIIMPPKIKSIFTDKFIAGLLLKGLNFLCTHLNVIIYNMVFSGKRKVEFDKMKLDDMEIEELRPYADEYAPKILQLIPDWLVPIIHIESIYWDKAQQVSVEIPKKELLKKVK